MPPDACSAAIAPHVWRSRSTQMAMLLPMSHGGSTVTCRVAFETLNIRPIARAGSFPEMRWDLSRTTCCSFPDIVCDVGCVRHCHPYSWVALSAPLCAAARPTHCDRSWSLLRWCPPTTGLTSATSLRPTTLSPKVQLIRSYELSGSPLGLPAPSTSLQSFARHSLVSTECPSLQRPTEKPSTRTRRHSMRASAQARTAPHQKCRSLSRSGIAVPLRRRVSMVSSPAAPSQTGSGRRCTATAPPRTSGWAPSRQPCTTAWLRSTSCRTGRKHT